VKILFLLLLPTLLLAQNGVFFESSPLGAMIVLNESVLQAQTPFLLRDLKPGKHKVTIFRDGFESVTQTIQVPPKGFVRLNAELKPDTVSVSFTQESEIFLIDEVRKGRGVVYNLQQGGYQLTSEDGRSRIVTIFPEEGQLFVSSWLLPVTIGSSLGLTIRDILLPWLPNFIFSPATLASYAVTLFNVGWYLGLSNKKRYFEQNLIVLSEPVSNSTVSAQFLFDRAQLALNADNLLFARNYLTRLFQEHPQHPLAAQALFLLSRLALIRGDLREARSMYYTILHLYPVQDIYDRTVKVLADLAYNSNNKDEVRRLLALLTFTDPAISEESIQELKKWAEEE
jgi:TolA-binding protein